MSQDLKQYQCYLKSRPQTDPIQDMIYRQQLQDATRGSIIKQKYRNGEITLMEYLEKERETYKN